MSKTDVKNDDSLVEIALSAITPITDVEFTRFRELIYKVAGISLNESKQQLVASRLAKRLRAHGLKSYSQYYGLLENAKFAGPEMTQFVNCITTNKTSFFREAHHFDFLRQEIFPKLRSGEKSSLRIWSAACSMGDEPYTIAMTAASFFPSLLGIDLKILATDIDTDVLAHAAKAEYPPDHIEEVPEACRKFFVPVQGRTDHVQIRPELKNLITFRQLNFMEPSWPVKGKFDVIFCRNAMIYFDRETQAKLVKRFVDHLAPGGYLIIGHSETLHWAPELFRPLKGTIYQLKHGSDEPGPSSASAARPQAPVMRMPVVPPPPPPLDLARAGARAGDATIQRTNSKGAKEVSISIGGLYADKVPVVVKTVLGSCIAACLYDPEAKVGGMNHFLLPEGASDESMPTRYGVHAMEVLINEIMKQGGDRRRLVAKIFGASHVLKVDAASIQVPKKNEDFVRKFLATEHIRVVAEKLGGTQPLEVHFDVTTGRAFVRALGQKEVADTVAEESRFKVKVTQEFSKKAATDSVTLF